MAQRNAETPVKCFRFELGNMEEMDFVFENSSIPLPCKVTIRAAGCSVAGAGVNWRSGDDCFNQRPPSTCQNVLE